MAKKVRKVRPRIEKVEVNREAKAPDFLDVEKLTYYVSERGRILPRTRTGLLASEQRKLKRAIKRARYLALLPYSVKAK